MAKIEKSDMFNEADKISIVIKSKSTVLCQKVTNLSYLIVVTRPM